MIPYDLLSVIAGLLSAIAGLSGTEVIRRIIRNRAPTKTYSERMGDLTNSLLKASTEVDGVLTEMATVARERESSVKALEQGLADLQKREAELKETISVLQNVPLPVAEHFAKLVEPVEKRSAHRDYILFVSGVVVTTVIAIVLRKVFGI